MPVNGADRVAPLAPEAPGSGADPQEQGRTLLDDLRLLLDDLSTWLDAEVAYHRTRAAFAADRIKTAAISAVAALVVALLAAVGLVIGLIIALAPYLTAFGSTALVAGLLLVGAWVLVRRASRAMTDLRSSGSEGPTDG